MNSIAVIQARTNSSRLPGKVLLPIGGLPLSVLAAKRAANQGMQVLVATSKEPSDDALVRMLKRHGIPCFRGSLNNTLSRFVEALSEKPDNTLVFRLTADNPLPDGSLLKAMQETFETEGLEYLCCNGVPSGLPYGVSAELCRLGSLREAALSTSNGGDLEHVTPWVIRKFGRKYFKKYSKLNLGRYRATIDTLDDYLSMNSLFEQTENSIDKCAVSLSKEIAGLPHQPTLIAPSPGKLVFGTAQLGHSYGIANQTGKPSQEMAEKLLKLAISNGVAVIDTARAYESESVIGQALAGGWAERATIVTKLSPLADCPQGAGREVVSAFVDSSVYKSMTDLRTSKLDILMLHRAAHLSIHEGAVVNRLRELVNQRVIGTLGVSVQSPEELELALAESAVTHVQLPYSILDWRWADSIEKLKAERSRRALTVYVRSALLQGLLLSDDAALWERANLDTKSSAEICGWLKEESGRLGISRLELCLNFVCSETWVDGIVLGMENEQQLIDNLQVVGAKRLSPDQMCGISARRPRVTVATLNPASWNVQ